MPTSSGMRSKEHCPEEGLCEPREAHPPLPGEFGVGCLEKVTSEGSLAGAPIRWEKQGVGWPRVSTSSPHAPPAASLFPPAPACVRGAPGLPSRSPWWGERSSVRPACRAVRSHVELGYPAAAWLFPAPGIRALGSCPPGSQGSAEVSRAWL